MKINNSVLTLDHSQDFSWELVISPTIWGLLGAALLQSIYTIVLSVFNSPSYAWQQFVFLWPWMIPLIIGFGVQVGIFSYMRGFSKLAKSGKLNSGPVVTSGAISSGSMIACCLHHVADVLPVLGLSAVAVFLSQFQSFVLAVGIVANLIGIGFMFHVVQKHNLFVKGGRMAWVMSWNMKVTLNFLIVFGIIGLGILFFNQI